MDTPSQELCNPLARFSIENRSELPAPSAYSAVVVILLGLLAATAGGATANELCLDQPVVLASDPASPQLAQAKPADQSNPPERTAPEATASRFDAATLPSIESIDAQTDITVFLQNSVPNELRLAVLRRAWTVDSAIRDFKGLQENDWNFNDPNSVPGFGELGPDVDVKKMVAEILGEAPRMTFAARRTK